MGQRGRAVHVTYGVDAAGGGFAVPIDLDKTIFELDSYLFKSQSLCVALYTNGDKDNIRRDAASFAVLLKGGGDRVAILLYREDTGAGVDVDSLTLEGFFQGGADIPGARGKDRVLVCDQGDLAAEGRVEIGELDICGRILVEAYLSLDFEGLQAHLTFHDELLGLSLIHI